MTAICKRPQEMQRGEDECTPRTFPWTIAIALFALMWMAEGLDLRFPKTFSERTETIESVTEVSFAIERAYNPSRRFGIAGIGLLGVVCLFRRGRARIEIRGALGWSVLAFLALAGASPLWADDPGMAARRVVVLLLLAVGALGVGSVFAAHYLEHFAFATQSLVVLTGLLTAAAHGTLLDPESRLAGVQHPIGVAQSCGVVLMSAAAGHWPPRLRFHRTGMALLSGLVLLLTRSRGPALAATAGLLVALLAVARPPRRILLLSVLGAGACLALLAASLFGSEVFGILLLGRADSESATLTGRVPLWAESLRYLTERPLLGFGYGSFWTTTRFEEIAARTGFNVADVHNSYLDVALGLGLTGGTLVVLIVVLSLVGAFRKAESETAGGAFALAILTSLSLNMCLLTVFGQPQMPSFIALIVIAGLAFQSEMLKPRGLG